MRPRDVRLQAFSLEARAAAGGFITADELALIVPLHRTTIWRLERAGRWPARHRLGLNRVGWLAAEVMAHLRELPRGPGARPSEAV